MSKNTNISELINYLSYDGSGNIVFTTVPSATTNTDKFLVSDTGTLKFRTAAQLLSDIGAQASGSYQAALSGTGFVKILGSTISYDNSTYATETYVGTAISNLVASSPATLDTLNELALALGSDPNFATTVATSIGTKQAQLNGTGFVKVTGTTVSYDNSTYLTTSAAASTYLPLAGGTLTGALSGTSATFSGNLTLSTIGTYIYTYGRFATSGGNILFSNGTGENLILAETATNVYSFGKGSAGVAPTSNVLSLNLSTGAATFSSSVTANIIYSSTDFRTDGGTVKVGAGSNNYYTQLSTAYNYPYVDSYLDAVAGASYEGRLHLRTSSGGGALSIKMTVNNAGDIGVGTTTPLGRFNVVSGGANGIILSPDVNDTNNSGRLFLMRTGGEGWVMMNNAAKLSFRNGSVPINTSGTERFSVSASGDAIATGTVTGTTGYLGGGMYITSQGQANNTASAPSVNIGVYGGVYAFIDLATQNIYGSWIDFSKGDGTDYAGRIRYWNQDERFVFYTAGGGEKLVLNGAGHLLPGVDASFNLGSTTARWANVYTTDLHLSNEGKQNVVDGTWGDWTLQEGENDIFMLNNRSGEKFKIKLEKI